MARSALAMIFLALCASACATEQRTTVVATDDACTRYGFTAATVDYIRCQRELAAARRATRVVVGVSDAQLIAESQAACDSYGILRGSAPYDRCVRDEFAARRPG
jgi:hypothetical protein